MTVKLLCGAYLLLLAGCASTGGLHAQDPLRNTAQVASQQALANTRVSAAAWPQTDWWAQLGDPQLGVLIGQALENNPDLAASEARLRLSLAQTLGADAARAAQVNAKASLPGSQFPKELLPALGGNYATVKLASLSASYDFDLWGGARASWEAALGSQRAAEVDARAAALTLATRIAQVYNTLAYDFTAHDVAEADLTRAKRLLALTRQRVAAGLDSTGQQRQAEAAVANAEQRQAQTAQMIEAARIQLATLLGQGPDRGLAITRPLPLRSAALEVPDNLPADLIGRRPDIVAARWRVEAARHGIDAAKARFYPNVNLSATLGLVALHTTDLFESASRFAMVTPAISLPLFDGGRLRANLASRDAEYDLAVAQYNKVLIGAFNEVADSLSHLRALQTQLAAQLRARNDTREAWDLATQRYRNGVGGYVDVLVVQQSLNQAEERLAQLQSEQIQSSLDLIRALGGGFALEASDQAALASLPESSAPATP